MSSDNDMLICSFKKCGITVPIDGLADSDINIAGLTITLWKVERTPFFVKYPLVSTPSSLFQSKYTCMELSVLYCASDGQ